MFQIQEPISYILCILALSIFYTGYLGYLLAPQLKRKSFLKFVMPCMVLVTLFPSFAGLFIYLIC